MKKICNKLSILFLITLLVFFATTLGLQVYSPNVVYSKDFMENYFEEISSIKTDEEKENMLIAISPTQIQNTHDAKKVIEAPNNQYVLQYETKEQKENALQKLKEDDSIEAVEENSKRYLTDDVFLASTYNSWGVEAMGVDNLLNQIAKTQYDGLNDIVIAIIDSGVDTELFNQNYPGKLLEGYNIADNNNDLTDDIGHGTHIAGIIAECTPDNVKILPVKVTKSKTISTTDIIAGINYATYINQADVLNLSFGGDDYNDGEYSAIETARTEKNIISLAAIGNDNANADAYYPSAYDNTMSITAVDSDLKKASFSNYGETATFSAPGVSILSINGTKSRNFYGNTAYYKCCFNIKKL